MMIDAVHIFKCIRNNWFRKREWDVKGEEKGKISWLLLHKLMEHEKKYPVKKAFHLNSQVLKPNNFQKMRVSLAMKAVDWRTRNALLYYGKEAPELFPPHDVAATTKFMDHARCFFDVMNVNHVKKGPITSMECPKMTQLYLVQKYFEETIFSTGMYSILKRETNSILSLFILRPTNERNRTGLDYHYQWNFYTD